MAKNLKLKVKNEQLAKALKLKTLKQPAKKTAVKKTATKTTAAPKKVSTKPKPTVIRKAEALKTDTEATKDDAENTKNLSTTETPEVAASKVETPPTQLETTQKQPTSSAEEAPSEETQQEVPKPETKSADSEKTEEKPKAKEAAAKPSKLKENAPSAPQQEVKVVKKGKDDKAAKGAKKMQTYRPFDSRDRQGLRADEEVTWRKKRTFKNKASRSQEKIEPVRPSSLKIRLPITVKDLAQDMKLKASQIISKLFLEGIVITLNDYLEDETTVQLIGHEFGCEITIDTSEEERLRITEKSIQEEIAEASEDNLKSRPPVITFMGHVDHGKTSLIDTIRKSNVASGEAGAITQHIGAFKCSTSHGDVTILDTPGHEAFSLMRKRGAAVTDIVVLVVAGDEGLKDQTFEAIDHAIESQIPLVVAINKSDKPDFNPDEVYRQLADKNLLPEAWGGTTITVNCSAKTGEGIKELLELVALQAEILELKADPTNRARGAVIESQLHKGLGNVATVLVQNGTLHLNDALIFDQIYGRVKTMHDEHGENVEAATPSTPVKITGLSGLPDAGCDFIVVDNERVARKLCQERSSGHKRALLKQTRADRIENLLQQESEKQGKKIVNVIIRADVQGSLEALKNSLEKIKSKKVDLNIISHGVGEISESDIELAAASNATVIGFHTAVETHAEPLISRLKVKVVNFDVIYHIVDHVKQIMLESLDKVKEEQYAGSANVIAVFKASQLGMIAGCTVSDGIIKKEYIAKQIRGKEVIWEGTISSLKRVKEDVKEVSKGLECGILLNKRSDIQVGDKIEAYEIIYKTQSL